MKYMNALHARVNSPYAAALESQGELAMEGMADSIKAKWNLLKQKFQPDHLEIAREQLAIYAQMKKDAGQLKSAISQSREDKAGTFALNSAAKKLPVDAANTDQLIANLSAFRKKATAEFQRISTLKDEAEANNARTTLMAEMRAQGQIADNLTFNRAQAIKFLDELVAWITVCEVSVNATIKAAAASKQQGVATEHFKLAMEALEDDSIALEGFWNKAIAYYQLYNGYCGLFGTIIYALIAIWLLVTGSVLFAGVVALYAGASWWAGNLFIKWGKARLAQETEEQVAQEGFLDSVKEGFAVLKEKIVPSEATKAKSKLELLAKMKKDAAQLKTGISQSREGTNVTSEVTLTTAARALPVKAATTDELLKNSAALRMKTAAQLKKIEGVTDEVEAKALKQQIDAALNAKGDVVEKLTFTRTQALKLLDEIIGWITLAEESCKLTIQTGEKAGKDGVAQEGFALALEEQTIALEGFWNKFLGFFWLYNGVSAYIGAILQAVAAIFMLVQGAPVLALIYVGLAAINWFAGNIFVRWGRIRFARDGYNVGRLPGESKENFDKSKRQVEADRILSGA
jgi:plasmid maintenance system antidote protein VapI